MRLACFALWAVALSTIGYSSDARGASLQQLYDSIRRDSAYKVRMQAIRILTQRLREAPAPPPDAAMAVLADAVRFDESYLVRGLACFSLGKLADSRGMVPLEAALKDSHPFVRAQAEEALRVVRESERVEPAPLRLDQKPRLLVVVEPSAGLDISEKFSASFEESIVRAAKDRFEFKEPEDARPGFRLSGRLLDLSVHDTGDGQKRVTITVKVTITTWPANNLRHVVSAKASANLRRNSAISVRLKEQLLHAAIDKAAVDSIAQLGGG